MIHKAQKYLNAASFYETNGLISTYTPYNVISQLLSFVDTKMNVLTSSLSFMFTKKKETGWREQRNKRCSRTEFVRQMEQLL